MEIRDKESLSRALPKISTKIIFCQKWAKNWQKFAQFSKFSLCTKLTPHKIKGTWTIFFVVILILLPLSMGFYFSVAFSQINHTWRHFSFLSYRAFYFLISNFLLFPLSFLFLALTIDQITLSLNALLDPYYTHSPLNWPISVEIE